MPAYRAEWQFLIDFDGAIAAPPGVSTPFVRNVGRARRADHDASSSPAARSDPPDGSGMLTIPRAASSAGQPVLAQPFGLSLLPCTL